MSSRRSTPDFEIHVDPDCLIPDMEEPTTTTTPHTEQPDVLAEEPVVQPEPEPELASPSTEHVDEAAVVEPEAEAAVVEPDAEAAVAEPEVEAAEVESDIEADATPAEAIPTEDETILALEPDTTDADTIEESTTEEPELNDDSLHSVTDEPCPEEHVPEEAEEHEAAEPEQNVAPEQLEEDHERQAEEQPAEPDHDATDEPSELEPESTDAETQDGEEDATSLDRRHSVRTEALIQAAARAVVSLRQDGGEEGDEQQNDEDPDESMISSTTNESEESESPDDVDVTVHLDHDDDTTLSRPQSSASRSIPSPTGNSSVGDATESGSHRGLEDDVFSDRSPRSSTHSVDEHFDDDALEQMTEKGDQSPYVRSRVTSGVSVSGASEMSDLSRLSRYEKEDFVPTSRNNRPAFRSPSSVRAIQMSSPTPSAYSSSGRSAKRPTGFPTISRLGSPAVSGQFSPKGRSTTSRFKRPDPAPLVLLHVTLLPLRWGYGDVVNHFEAKKLPPIAFSNEGMKNLRGAWRQLQDRLGDTVLERGILLPHPQNDYEILEERMLEALELPLRRRARILECGHYLGPSNVMATSEDVDDDSEYGSDTDGSGAETKPEKKHWCKTCKGDIRYEELGSERMFRIKVYASNGLMSAGAWEACWKEMERVDIEVEPIIDSAVQSDLAKLSAAFDLEHQQQLEAEQTKEAEEEQRLQLEIEQRLSLEEERHQLEVQRQQFEEERRRAIEEADRRLEEERRKMDEEQRQRLEEERRQQFEEERQLLDAQRQQFEEQRLELEQQRKLVEEEQRQHLEEARRQELEMEQRLIEEQRQQLEEARQQFEEERRQRLDEEEELRRLQREEDEQKQVAEPRSTSRNSYVEDALVSATPDIPSSTDIDGRRRDSDRLREIYGAESRASSDGMANTSSPAIHIHVDSGRQREEEQNSRQLATIPAPRDSLSHTVPTHEARHQDAYMAQPPLPPPPPPPSAEQTYQRQDQRKPLDAASLPELLGETIRVLLQDPKNVAIAVLVVFIAMLAGFTKREEHGVEMYKPQQHYREPVGQVIMNTPPAPLVETVYKTITSEVAPPKVQATREVEVVYHTVTQQPIQETATRIIETVYSTVTQSLVQPPPAQAAIEHPAAPEIASELPPSDADPSVDLKPLLFDSLDGEDSAFISGPTSSAATGFNPFVCPAAFVELDTDSEPPSNEPIFKDITEADPAIEPQESDTLISAEDSVETDSGDRLSTSVEEAHEEMASATATNTVQEFRVTTTTHTVTETVYATATPEVATRLSEPLVQPRPLQDDSPVGESKKDGQQTL